MAARPLTSPACPAPLARAPRAARAAGLPRESLRLAPAGLHGALLALVARDTSALALDDAQRLTHFPASPFVTISWFRDTDVGLVTPGPHGPAWTPFGASVVVSGTQSQPTVSWSPATGRGHVACFTADAAQALFGLHLAAIQDRFVPAGEAIGPEFAPLWDALLASDDAGIPEVLERHLARR